MKGKKSCPMGPWVPLCPPRCPNGQVWSHFGPFRAKGHPDAPLGQFCYYLKPFPFGRLSLATAFISEWVSFRHNPPLEMAFHSEWLRNNPKGPMGPSPQSAEGALGSPWAPWGPLGSLRFPWAPLAPFSLLPWALWALRVPWVVGVGVGSLGCLWTQGIGTM